MKYSKHIYKVCLLAVIFLHFHNPNTAYTQTPDQTDENRGWGGYPVIFYTNRTNLALGAYGIRYFQNENVSHKSMLTFAFIYTLKNQFITRFESKMFWQDYRLIANLDYYKFPDTYYGIGNNTSVDDAENFTAERVDLDLNFQKQIQPNLFMGIQYDFETHDLIETEPDKELGQGMLPGTQGSFKVSGLGFSINYDTRDHVVCCCHGSYMEFSWNIYDDITGSDFRYMEYYLDLRHFLQVSEKSIFAVQGTYSRVTGNVPIQVYPVLGDDRLRGFSARYRDKNMLTLQAEYRMSLFKDFGVTFFAGMGDVADHFSNFNFSEFKFGAGFGIRYMILPANRFNLRIDIGIGTQGNSSMSFLPGEAF